MPSMLFNLTAALLAASAYATNLLSHDNPLVLRSSDVLHKPYAALLDRPPPPVSAALLAYDSGSDGIGNALYRRQNPSASSGDTNSTSLNATEPGIRLTPSGTLNFTAWSAAVNPACAQSLSALKQATNPSGACVCYNIISLDVGRGMFEADLRLFEVSPPRGSFVGVRPEDIKVFLDYNGATANGTNQTSADGAMQGAGAAGQGKASLNQVYRIKGQIDKSRMDDNMTISALEILLMPKITLRVTGTSLSTTVSANEASFLAGVFSSQSVMSDFSAAQLAVDEALLALRNGTAAFVLPGVQLMVFPVGLVISGTWLLVGLAAYGFGTFERMRYRDMYRSRTMRKGGVNTI